MQLSWPAASRCSRAIPERLESINDGLNTLQFQSLSISPHDSKIRQGGTQDNGTWQTNGSKITWENTMIGDGGQSGFDVAIPEFRFHNFTGVTTDVNFNNGNIADWIWISDPVAHGGEFYAPVISDPVVSKTMFAGTSRTAYRTQDGRPRHEDSGRGERDLQRVDRHLRGSSAVTGPSWARRR